jgi:hypothetical protein
MSCQILGCSCAVLMTLAGCACADDRLGAVGHLELAEDIRDVVAHGLLAERQVLGDLWIGDMLRDRGRISRLRSVSSGKIGGAAPAVGRAGIGWMGPIDVGIKEQGTMSTIHFEAKLFTIGSWTILRLPESASAKLPSRGMTMVWLREPSMVSAFKPRSSQMAREATGSGLTQPCSKPLEQMQATR